MVVLLRDAVVCVPVVRCGGDVVVPDDSACVSILISRYAVCVHGSLCEVVEDAA